MNPKRKYYDSGQIESEVWENEAGGLHRLDGPAWRCWFRNGQLRHEEWRVNDYTHRLDGPAYRLWHTNGQLWHEVWYINGNKHRLDGPAYREWFSSGKRLRYAWWYINDVRYETEAEFQVAVDLYKANEIAELF